MKSASQQAINMISRNQALSNTHQLLIDEFRVSKRLFIVLLGLLFIISGVLLGSNSIPQLLNMPIEYVEVRGNLKFVDQKKLQNLVARHIHKKYLTENLSFIKTQIETMPWIDSARLQRSWPNKLYIDIVEQKPIAVWLDKGLINERGALFVPENFAELNTSTLPKIFGPAERLDQTWQLYLALKNVFAEYNLGIRKMILDEKGGQKIVLNNGIHVILGSQELEQRLVRFFKVYKHHLEYQRQHIKSIDLRYTNGVAVAWMNKDILQHHLVASINEE